MSIGEAALAFPVNGVDVAQIFKNFYNGFTKNTTVCFAYNNSKEYELPIGLNLAKVYGDSADLFKIMTSPAILPVGFHCGRNQLQPYKFHRPLVATDQLEFGQMSM